MNEYDIYDAHARWQDHPALGPATATLRNLMGCANANSDGWAYWPKPARAAEKLMALIEGDGTHESRYGDREDVTLAQVKAAYRPIKSFLTRHKLECEIVEPWAAPKPTVNAPVTVMAAPTLPVPNESFRDSTVIASCIHIEDDERNIHEYGVVLLNRESPFYTVAILDALNDLAVVRSTDFPNIIPAAAHYQAETGVY